MGTHKHLTSEYKHPEAFCMLLYHCGNCNYREQIWNSRDGVTPFIITCRECNGKMQHVRWENDECIPDYKPTIRGQRFFVDLTKEKLEELSKKKIERYWNDSLYTMSKMYKSKEDALRILMESYSKGMPYIETVGAKEIDKEKREGITRTRRQRAGIQMADALLGFIHLMYQKDTATGVINALIKRLEERKEEFKRERKVGTSRLTYDKERRTIVNSKGKSVGLNISDEEADMDAEVKK